MGLERIEIDAFCGALDISKLVLNYNKLTSFPQLCSLKCCLVELHIANNNISRLSKHSFKGFKKIKIINLSNNNLHVLPDLHWVKHSLSHLTANENKIQSLDSLQTSGIYRRLQYITVADNDIRHFNISILRHMPKLDYLGLHSNNLTHIDDFRSLCIKIIILGRNPWDCVAELSWMGEADMSFQHDLTCATPTCRHGMAITVISK